MKNTFLKYAWILPAAYVTYQFSGKLFEVLDDPQEFVDIISVVTPLAPYAHTLAYAVGVLDFIVGLAVLLLPLMPATQRFYSYIFAWVIVWPFVPSSLRYFSGLAEFEIVTVLSMSCAAIFALLLYRKFTLRGAKA